MEGKWVDVNDHVSAYVEGGMVTEADYFNHRGKVYVHDGKGWVLREDLTLEEFKTQYEKGGILVKK